MASMFSLWSKPSVPCKTPSLVSLNPKPLNP
jgi:hypothetical protein